MAVLTRESIDTPADAGELTKAVEQQTQLLIEERSQEGRAGPITKPEVDFLDWAVRIPTVRGPMLDFDRYPFQPELYRVFGDITRREVDLMKGVQVGASELMTRLTLWLPDSMPANGLYVFPAQKQMWDYSDTRVSPLREQSEYLRSRTQLGPGWTWNKGLKRIGHGNCYYRGSESKRDLIAVDADLVAMDEYDQLHPPNIPQAERRITGSQLGLIRRVGVPSDPEYGIAKRFEQSDKREWHVECEACGEWQPLDFWKNVRWDEDDAGIITDPRRVCQHCERRLDVAKGEWVAEFPSREKAGFHAHRLMVPGTNLVSLIEASKLTDSLGIAAFHNEDLGRPYSDKAGGLDRLAIASAISAGTSWNGGTPLEMVGAYRGPNLVTMGVDVASVRALNYRISEHLDSLTVRGHRKRALAVGTAASFDEIVQLLDRYGVHFAVIDHAPEGRLAMGVAEMFPGRVYLGVYSSQQKEALVVDTGRRTVTAQRNPTLDAVVGVMRAQRNFLPEDIPADYVKHMVAVRKRIEKDEYDRQTVTYVSVGPDDYFHTEAYDILATEVAKVRLEAEAMEEQTREVVALDERLEYERSKVTDPESMEYRPGPSFGGYRGGPGWRPEDDD